MTCAIQPRRRTDWSEQRPLRRPVVGPHGRLQHVRSPGWDRGVASDPAIRTVCVGIVGHYLERCVVEALSAGLADPAIRQRLVGADPALVASVTSDLDAVERDLAILARRWGLGEITRVEWDAARAGLSGRAQGLRVRLGALSVPAFDPTGAVESWDRIGLAVRRSILRAVFARIEVLSARTTLYDPRPDQTHLAP